MSKPTDTPKRYFLAQYVARIDEYERCAGFYIRRELDGPEIPADLDQAGTYVVLEVVRKFQIGAVVTYKTEEFTT